MGSGDTNEMSRHLSAADLRAIEAMGAKTLGINLHVLALEAPVPSALITSIADAEPETEGARLIAAFVVPSRPVPWKVAIHRDGYATNPKMVLWKKEVKKAAKRAMGNRKPWAGPYLFKAEFHLRYRGSMPDDCNLIKSTEDALEGVVIINDNMSRRKVTDYFPGAQEDKAVIEVWAMRGRV